jgi:hypothetical protein
MAISAFLLHTSNKDPQLRVPKTSPHYMSVRTMVLSTLFWELPIIAFLLSAFNKGHYISRYG